MAEFPLAPEGDFDPRPILRKFLIAFQTLLEEVIALEPGDLIEADLHPFVVRAFPSIPPQLNLMHSTLEAWWVPQQLTVHGLDGTQLALKLALVGARNREFNAVRGPRLTAAPAPRGAGRGIFRRVLEAIDIPFESLAAALGVGDAVAEFKKVLEKAIPSDFAENR
ncbi:MAG: hypothetical protein EPN98_06735 [Phenylobacterium sp.]|uniref:hypothetical protein n=1 Tax=Phenylobacterium sp. TaxID=1871053 RepID=UPI001201EECC|nr:hypothetical protein [Phenylobacterium sp.]TAL35653.1 MAG: hypothetical protein EPN98_06735 [Phenylobacterium sp.]